MRKNYHIGVIFIAVGLFLFMNACNKDDSYVPIEDTFEVITPENDRIPEINENENVNSVNSDVRSSYRIGFVDERFELVSLVFRLAGKEEYNESSTAYQRQIDSTFSDFKHHPIVVYTAQNLHFGYDAVFNMAIHLEKEGSEFAFINNTDSLFREMGGTTIWTLVNTTEFLELLNDFYQDTDFSSYFNENAEYYEELSERFNNDIYDSINFEWFRQHGRNPDNFQAIISPSSSLNGYGGWVYGTISEDIIAYAALPGLTDYIGYTSFVIHEFAHSIGNLVAEELYLENEEFRRWSDDSVDIFHLPYYSSGMIMACEYVTRAYTILYMVEISNAYLSRLLHAEIAAGFPYIQQVYALITDYEVMEISNDVSVVLGTDDYIIGEEQSLIIGGHLIKWHHIDMLDHELILEDYIQTDVGNIFGSHTGDVLLVIKDDYKYLYIDLGSAEHQGWSSQHRMYSIYLVNWNL